MKGLVVIWANSHECKMNMYGPYARQQENRCLYILRIRVAGSWCRMGLHHVMYKRPDTRCVQQANKSGPYGYPHYTGKQPPQCSRQVKAVPWVYSVIVQRNAATIFVTIALQKKCYLGRNEVVIISI